MSEVDYLQVLSKLKLTEEEKSQFEGEFKQIIAFVDEIKSVELTKEYDKDEPVKLDQLRSDEPRESMSRELVLSNAPNQKDGCYSTPMVVE